MPLAGLPIWVSVLPDSVEYRFVIAIGWQIQKTADAARTRRPFGIEGAGLFPQLLNHEHPFSYLHHRVFQRAQTTDFRADDIADL